MIKEGFRFGMLLQLAVGPVCLFVFQTAARGGFGSGERAVAGVALADGLFMALAMLGITAFLARGQVKLWVSRLGAAVIGLFGFDLILGSFSVSVLPSFQGFSAASGYGPFWRGFLLTASNPLTILFWAGIFTTRIAENRGRDIGLFGIGALGATLCFLSLVAAAGSAAESLLGPSVIRLLNAAVGLLLLGFAWSKLRGPQSGSGRSGAGIPQASDVGSGSE